MVKSREKLTPIPRRKAASPAAPPDQASPIGDDLSYITPSLRPLAVPISDVAFMLGNPLLHPEDQLEDLRASLREFGQVEPLVVNRRPSPPVVIGGNGRLQAALSLGWSHVAVAFVDLSDARANALAVVLNRSRDGSEWDSGALDKIMADLDIGGDEQLAAMMDSLKEDMAAVAAAGLKQLETKPPPRMTWVLLGIPTVRFGEIAADVERLAQVPGIVLETTVNDGDDEDGQLPPGSEAGAAATLPA